MITIDQLLESVDLDFEPRWVTRNNNGVVQIWAKEPFKNQNDCWDNAYMRASFGLLKLTDFANKNWTECIYEVPRKTTGKIERLTNRVNGSLTIQPTNNEVVIKINELVDMVNNIISVQEKMIDSRFVVDAVNELKGE